MVLQVGTIEAYGTDLHWYPVGSKRQQAGGTDVFALACTDGTQKLWLPAGFGLIILRRCGTIRLYMLEYDNVVCHFMSIAV